MCLEKNAWLCNCLKGWLSAYTQADALIFHWLWIYLEYLDFQNAWWIYMHSLLVNIFHLTGYSDRSRNQNKKSLNLHGQVPAFIKFVSWLMCTLLLFLVGGCFCTCIFSQMFKLEENSRAANAPVSIALGAAYECKTQTKQRERLVDLFNLRAEGPRY